MTQTVFSSLNNSSVMLQAQQYAAAEGDIVRYTAYNDLAAQNKTKITDTEFFKEISLGAESDYTDTIKQKIVSLKIYKGSASFPCYTLEVPRLSADVSNAKGVPIGTVIAWASNNAPTENGTWLECDGQSCAAYPELVRVLGKNTVPDYRGRFLEGANVVGTVKEAGLPNIVGSFGNISANNGYMIFQRAVGAFVGKDDSKKGYEGNPSTLDGSKTIVFNASLCSPIYGNSETVQPPSVTVRYFIKAA